MSFDRAIAIADAVLLEGYLLYPYRASSTKNQFRWAFGVLAPQAWSENGGCESWWMETQCLVASASTKVRPTKVQGRLRFLQLQARRLEKEEGGAFRELEALDVDGHRLMPWDEGELREIDFVQEIDPAGARIEQIFPFSVPGGELLEDVFDSTGAPAGRIRRNRQPIEGRLRISSVPLGLEQPLARLTIRVENLTPWAALDAPRDAALHAACVSTHLLLRVAEGSFISLLDPPGWASAAAAGCKSVRGHPVLADEPGRDDLILASPIILYDHPKIAPESPGDLFDGTEIDEILTLRTLLLTDEEKREARATDARAAAIVDRTDRLQPAEFARMHGTFRDLHRSEMVPRAGQPADPPLSPRARFGPDPDEGNAGHLAAAYHPGRRVFLRPGNRRTDAQDLLYAGRVALIEKVVRDIDGRDLLAVTIDGDPAADFHRWYGRFHYYALDEVEPVPESAP